MPRMTEVRDKSGTLTASVAVYAGSGKPAKSHVKRQWQKEAWRYYDRVGELRYGVNWVANVAARAKLYAGHIEKDGTVKQSPQIQAKLDELFGGPKGQSKMLHAMALHLSVAGECFVVGRGRRPDDTTAEAGDVWEVVGTEEISYVGNQWMIKYGDRDVILEESAVLIQIWLPHPRKRDEADSPVRGVLSSLREVVTLSQHIHAQATSRLTGAGVFAIPSSLDFKRPDGVPDDATNADVFSQILGEQMGQALDNVGSPESQTPVIVTASAEDIAAMKQFQFWSQLDEHVIDMRKDEIRRIALGLDIPAEVMLGTSEVNRWGAWQIEESSIKTHIEPLLEVISAALSVGYLQKLTGDQRDVVLYDTSVLRLRPNRSKEAVELYDRGVLGLDTLLRETGFTLDDKMGDEDRKTWILLKMITASWTPQQAQEAANQLGVDLGIDTTDNEPRQARPTPSLRDHPVRDRPEKSVSDGTAPNIREREERANAASASTAFGMVAWRAMERAGNRLRTVTGQSHSSPDPENTHLLIQPFPDKIDDLLKGAWAPVVPLAQMYDVDPTKVTSVLDGYCRDLLSGQRRFTLDQCVDEIAEKLKAGA